MHEILSLTWKRFNIISTVVGDAQGRLIATLFYFTIFLPFALIARFFTDPLRQKDKGKPFTWLDRQPVPTDLESAQRQG